VISITDTVLPTDLADAVSCYADRLWQTTDPVFSTNYAWETDSHQSHRERYQYLILTHNLKLGNPHLNKKISDSIRHQYPGYQVHQDLVQIYFWSQHSRIEWHNDGHSDHPDRCGGVTIYLNQNWQPEWGGDFLYRSTDSDVQRITPVYNRGVFITDLEHRTTPVTGTEWRKTLQIWISET